MRNFTFICGGYWMTRPAGRGRRVGGRPPAASRARCARRGRTAPGSRPAATRTGASGRTGITLPPTGGRCWFSVNVSDALKPWSMGTACERSGFCGLFGPATVCICASVASVWSMSRRCSVPVESPRHRRSARRGDAEELREQVHDRRLRVEVEAWRGCRSGTGENFAESLSTLALEERIVRAEVEPGSRSGAQRVPERLRREPALVRLLRALEVPGERREVQARAR